MGVAGNDFRKGERGYENVEEVLCGGGASVDSILVRDVVTDPLVREIP